jgi:hypothetical protein
MTNEPIKSTRVNAGDQYQPPITYKKSRLAPQRNSMEKNWEWSLAHPLHDIDDMVEMADSQFGHEADGILKRDRSVFRHRATVATTEQLFNKSREFIAVCRDSELKTLGEDKFGEFYGNPLLGFCWFDRGGYTTYSNEEISNAKFHHLDLSLPVRTRVRLINEMIDQHILWAHTWGIPVVCSTSIRAEHDGFMKIHKKRGFTVNGSYGWIRTEEAMKCLAK